MMLPALFALTLSAAPVVQDDVELTVPWFEGLALTLAVERRVERLEAGAWSTVDGESSTVDVKVERQTDAGRWQLGFTARESRSLLADAGTDDAGTADAAHGVAALTDGVAAHFLCDDYGVPDTLVEVEATVAALRGRRAALIASLEADLGPVAGALVPAPETFFERWIELGDAWCVPLGYYLVEGSPLQFDYFESPAWSALPATRSITYRIERLDRAAGLLELSCDDRPVDVDSDLAERLGDAGYAQRQSLGPVERTDWTFDLESGLPTLSRRVTLERHGDSARRVSLTVRVVER